MRINRNSEYSGSKQDKEHLKFGLPPSDLDTNILKFNRKIFLSVLILIAIAVVIWLLGLNSDEKINITSFASDVIASDLFYLALLVGLLAQLVDGSLGMAYGITSTSFLIGIGASPAAASGAVHIAEIFTTAFSGISHIKFGNVRKDLFKKLVVPGVLGNHDQKIKHVRKLAFSGGFLDAIGGGGWGPVVTSTLIGQGNSPRHTIGSVNTAEFFVSFATGITFMLLGGIDHWIFVVGLIIGGLFSAPFAAYLTSKLSTKQLLIAVGLLITGVSIFNLYKIFG